MRHEKSPGPSIFGLTDWKPVAGDWDGRWGVGVLDASGKNLLSGGRDGV